MNGSTEQWELDGDCELCVIRDLCFRTCEHRKTMVKEYTEYTQSKVKEIIDRNIAAQKERDKNRRK